MHVRRSSMGNGRAIALTVAVVLFAQLGTQGVRAEDVGRMISSAEDAFARREYARAVQLLEQLRAQDPGRREVDFNLGVTEQAAGHYSLAARHFNLYAQSLPPGDSRDVTRHASQLSRYDQWQASGAPPRKRFPWWGWVIVGGGTALVATVVAVMLIPTEDTYYYDEY